MTHTRAPAPSGEHAGAATPATVLLVDDEEDIRFLARLQLHRVAGFEIVAEASDGVEAIDVAREVQPAVVLLDVMMPRMDGHAALPELLRVSPHSMVVMLSALDARSHEEPAVAAGAFAYLEKDAVTSGFGETMSGLWLRFQRALAGQTVWAPEGPRH